MESLSSVNASLGPRHRNGHDAGFRKDAFNRTKAPPRCEQVVSDISRCMMPRSSGSRFGTGAQKCCCR